MLSISLQASSTATSTTGVPYANEYMVIFRLRGVEDGTIKIESTKEFVDSQASTEFFPAEMKRQEERRLMQERL